MDNLIPRNKTIATIAKLLEEKEITDGVLIHNHIYIYPSINEIIHEQEGDHECGGVSRKCFTKYIYSNKKQLFNRESLVEIKKILEFLHGPNKNTIALAFTLCNNIAKVAFGVHSNEYRESKMIMKLTPEDAKRRRHEAQLKREDRNKQQREVERKVIEKWVEDLRVSSNILDKIILVALASGARMCEILTIGRFYPSPGKNHIQQIGQGKERLERGGVPRFIHKPVIFIPRDEFFGLIQAIRQVLTLTPNRDFTTYYSARLGPRVKSILGEKFKFHDLRAIYGIYSFEKHAKAQSLPAWLSSVLGHAPGNMSASLAYSTIKLI